jgi:radical SAM superfamily enzyme YgiQ (UPF0313 family)
LTRFKVNVDKRIEFVDDNINIIWPYARLHSDHRFAFIHSGLRLELAFLRRIFNRIKILRDFLDTVLIADKDNILRNVLGAQIDMVDAAVWI